MNDGEERFMIIDTVLSTHYNRNVAVRVFESIHASRYFRVLLLFVNISFIFVCHPCAMDWGILLSKIIISRENHLVFVKK